MACMALPLDLTTTQCGVVGSTLGLDGYRKSNVEK
jgi:hypothetical protein